MISQRKNSYTKINNSSTLFIILILVCVVELSPVLIKKRLCPNENFCSCNWDKRKIECSIIDNMTSLLSFNHSIFNFSNKSYKNFSEIYLNNLIVLDLSFFKGSTFSSKFKLSINLIKHIGKHFISNISGLNYLEITYSDLKQIESGAFDFLNVKSLTFTAKEKNFPININIFGQELTVNSLHLDFNSLSFMKKVFWNGNVEWLSLALKRKFKSNFLKNIDPNTFTSNESDMLLSREELIKYW